VSGAQLEVRTSNPEQPASWTVDTVAGLIANPGDTVLTVHVNGRETAIVNRTGQIPSGGSGGGGGVTDHTLLTNIGVNTHAQLDAFLNTSINHQTASANIHGTTGAIVGADNAQTLTNKTLTTPTIGNLSNAQHGHTNAAGGGALDAAVIGSGVIAPARLGSGTPSTSNYLRGDGSWQAVASGGVTDHTQLTNIGTNTHAQIDTSLNISIGHQTASANIHGTTGAIVGEQNTQTLTNKTLTTPVINSPTGITKANVGLSSVDNTADSAKPVSTAQQAALNLLVPRIGTHWPLWETMGAGNEASPSTHGLGVSLELTASLNAGWVYFVPFYIHTPFSVNGLRLSVTGAVASSTIRCGLFTRAAVGSGNMNLVIDGGTVATDTSGDKLVSFASTPLSGWAWAAVASTHGITVQMYQAPHGWPSGSALGRPNIAHAEPFAGAGPFASSLSPFGTGVSVSPVLRLIAA
jgi:hypothetical protein